MNTTGIYTHVLNRGGQGVRSPAEVRSGFAGGPGPYSPSNYLTSSIPMRANFDLGALLG